jgi:hypothetical protein
MLKERSSKSLYLPLLCIAKKDSHEGSCLVDIQKSFGSVTAKNFWSRQNRIRTYTQETKSRTHSGEELTGSKATPAFINDTSLSSNL